MKLFSNNCPQCKVVKGILDKKEIEYTLINDEEIVLTVAKDQGIEFVPFAFVDDKFLVGIELIEYINKL